MDAGGYAEDRPWWTPEAVKDIESASYNEGWRSGPRYWTDDRFNHATQPVVGISWYEAVAYCAWLSEKLGKEVRLPTQAEWERAARSSHGKEYPWGGDFDPAKANTKESKLNRTTPVHMYPDGRTPEGVWDLAGNVWEWSQDDRSGGKALTGGAWWNNAKDVGASARNGWDPGSGATTSGFGWFWSSPSLMGSLVLISGFWILVADS